MRLKRLRSSNNISAGGDVGDSGSRKVGVGGGVMELMVKEAVAKRGSSEGRKRRKKRKKLTKKKASRSGCSSPIIIPIVKTGMVQKNADGELVPDLNCKGLPFTQCKIVLSLNDDSVKGDGVEGNNSKKMVVKTGWRNLNNQFVYYDGVTLQQKEKMARKIQKVRMGDYSSESDCSEASEDDLDDVDDGSDGESDLFIPVKPGEEPESKEMLSSVVSDSDQLKSEEVTPKPCRKSLRKSPNPQKFIDNKINLLGEESDKYKMDYGSTIEALYKCPFCLFVYSEPKILIQHLRHHMNNLPEENISSSPSPISVRKPTGKESCRCNICGKGFSSDSVKLIHMRGFHGSKSRNRAANNLPRRLNRKQKNTFPGITIRETNSCKKTALKSTGKRSFGCNICGKSFSYRSSADLHIKTIHSNKRPFKCHTCGHSFRRGHHLRRHALIHTSLKPFQCVGCNVSFRRKTHLLRHNKSMHRSGTTNNSLDIIANRLVEDTSWKKSTQMTPFHIVLTRCDHLLLQAHKSEVKLAQLPECSVVLTRCDSMVTIGKQKATSAVSVSSSKSVDARETQLLKKKYSCTICSREFAWRSDLKRHILTDHEREKKFECSRCGKRFTRAHYVKIHIHAVHYGIKKFGCSDCGRRFPDNGQLKRHILNVHEGVKNHKCPHCGNRFSWAQNLKCHIQSVHHGVKNHKCPHCGNRFSCAQNLKCHIQSVHHGVKNHKCPHCGNRFSRAQHLRSHILLLHSGERPFMCRCSAGFIRNSDFKRHIHKYHTNTNIE